MAAAGRAPLVSSAQRESDLLRAEDRARLESLCRERGGTSRVDGYRIGPDDLLEIRIPDLYDVQAPARTASVGQPAPAAIAGAPAFQQGLRVDADGTVTVAMLGPVPAGGLTASELEREIARRLVERGILRAPQVSVLVVEHRSQVAAVVGSVERPGVYPITRPGSTLADLVRTAGGPTRDAGRLVQFTPAGGTASASGAANSPPIRMDLELLLHAQGAGACALDPPARPGDVISVSPAGNVQVAGWVDKPGSVPITRGLTAAGAVAAAGGTLFAADPASVTVKRVLGPGEERAWTVDLVAVAAGRARDVPLTDGDIVTVPPSAAKIVPYGLWTFGREMIHVGGSVPLF